MNISREKTTSTGLLLKEVAELEKTGKYSRAFDLLSEEIWTDITELPDVTAISPIVAAETYLRCGAIISYLGNSMVIFDAQEKAKNLLTIARNEFIKLYKTEKISECENRLSLAYYFKGEYKEASVWIEESLSHDLPSDREIRLHGFIIKTMILLAETHYQEVISLLESVKPHFEKTSYLLKGCFSTNISLALKNLGQLDAAIRYLNFARISHQKSKHSPFLATVENNLAQLYKLKKDFDKSLHCADNAVKLFTEIGDRARTAYAMETKAQVFIAKKDFYSAVELANEALNGLKFGDNAGILSEVYLTKSKALVGLGKISEAVLAVTEAVMLSKTAGNSHAEKISVEFELSLASHFPVKTKKVYSERENNPDNLALELPPEIAPNQELFGVWIKNSGFEKVGLKSGNLAIIVNCPVKKGDLVAVCDKQTDLVTIGFYENQYGLICLENYSREPELIDESQATIMGKIVGYALPETNKNDCYEVKLIVLEKTQDDKSNP